jgi:xylulokinase
VEEGAAYGAAILAMVGVDAYPNLTTALEIVPQEQSVVQPQANVVYKEAF